MFLSILGGSSRSMGGGDVWEECREQRPLFLSLFLPLSLHFTFSSSPLSFLSLPCGDEEWLLLCAWSCKVRVKRFVCFDGCQRVEMFNHSPVAVTGHSTGTAVIIPNRKQTCFLDSVVKSFR